MKLGGMRNDYNWLWGFLYRRVDTDSIVFSSDVSYIKYFLRLQQYKIGKSQ